MLGSREDPVANKDKPGEPQQAEPEFEEIESPSGFGFETYAQADEAIISLLRELGRTPQIKSIRPRTYSPVSHTRAMNRPPEVLDIGAPRDLSNEQVDAALRHSSTLATLCTLAESRPPLLCPSPHLVVIASGAASDLEKVFSLAKLPAVIGRGSDVTFQLGDGGVSKQHCKLCIDDGVLVVRDLGSTNGTYLRENRINLAEIRTGDILRLGGHVLLAVVASSEEIETSRATLRALKASPDSGWGYRVALYGHLSMMLNRSRENSRPVGLAAFQVVGRDTADDATSEAALETVLSKAAKKIQGLLLPNQRLFRYDASRFVAIAPESNLRDVNRLAKKVRALWKSAATREAGPHGSVRTSTLLCEPDMDVESAMLALHQKLPTADYLSVFLSYGEPDKAIAQQLYEELESFGIETFFFPDSANWGKQLHEAMSEGVHGRDRVLLLCSQKSLCRAGVRFEIMRTLAREALEGALNRLIPILLDDYLHQDWGASDRELQLSLRERVAADFRQPEMFSENVKRLAATLQV